MNATREELQALLERVEKATGPDRLLSRDLARTFGMLGHYTASIDAALALVERVLPGWHWIRKSPLSMTVYQDPKDEKAWAVHFDGAGATPALSLLAAILKALIAQQEAA